MNQKGGEILMANKFYKKKISLGYKPDFERKVTSSDKRKIHYPSMYISNTKLPLEAKEVGNKFRALIDVEFTGIRENTSKEKQSLDYEFDITAIQFIKSK